jgi:hypothetical protein
MIDSNYLLEYLKNYTCKAKNCYLHEDVDEIFNHFVQNYGFDINACKSVFQYGVSATICQEDPYVGQTCINGVDIYNGLLAGLNDLNNKKRSEIFNEKLEYYRANKDQIIARVKEQANDPEVIAYYKTVAEEFGDIDIEIKEYPYD